MSNSTVNDRVGQTLRLLNLHYDSFCAVAPYADETAHPVPTDTRGWSQVVVSLLCGVKGLKRQKGPDLEDGSDVKGANTWNAIDTPRFNGVIKAGTKATVSGTLGSLDNMPHLYLVLWDRTFRNTARCRIWVVRPESDEVFRSMCKNWYAKRDIGEIKSSNFQLHPPRGKDGNLIRNQCGNLVYPLYFCAERTPNATYKLLRFAPETRLSGLCRILSQGK